MKNPTGIQKWLFWALASLGLLIICAFVALRAGSAASPPHETAAQSRAVALAPATLESLPDSDPIPSTYTLVPVQAPQAPRPEPALQRPHQSIADILESVGDLGVPEIRAGAVADIRTIQQARRAIAERRAREADMPVRIERPDGTVMEIAGWDEVGPVYFITHNANAAISTGANLLQQSPYSLDGSDIVIGMWDGGGGRTTHREFATDRMVIMDGAGFNNHATHVGGTLAALGVTASARGMAPAARVDSYDWNNDMSEMTSRGASAAGQAGKIYLSNHSYGYVSGWLRTGGTNPAYIWYGSGTNADSIEPRFGQYNSYTRDSDALAFNAPYYLMFRSSGNERTDNPTSGQTVQLSPSNTATVSYDSALHPAGDGNYRGGYDTISFDSLAKNVITIGSVADAVTSGQRDISKANISSFSSWGPTDDGRIKPDLVANGEALYSTLAGGDSSYGTMSGTSMSSPNAAGTAALLISEYSRLFPGGAMRAATLKGLLIHTADDRGNVGPDYQYGWGLINAKAAVDLLQDHAANPLKIRLTENLITSSDTTLNHEFVWDGVSPIRATLSWTDPAGAATTNSDLRTARLRNNLDVRVVAPDGTQHYPYVMPFVGTWTQASMSLPATTGVNNTDNVEQVFIGSPGQSGVYRVVVSYQGTLANNQQHYSLLVSGSAAEEPPPPPLTLESISPSTALAGGSVQLDLTGLALDTATGVKLTQTGQPDIIATSLTMQGASLVCQVDLTEVAAGAWSVTVSNSEETSTLVDAFTVVGAIFAENFDGVVSGWTSETVTGSNAWSLVDNVSHTPNRSYFAPGPATRTTARLVSPIIPMPSNGSDMQIRFWHQYNLQNQRDGGRIEFSINGGTWFSVDDTNSGLSFAQGGYVATLSNRGGGPNAPSELGGKAAWTGNSNGFIETIININDTAKFIGKDLRIRWIIATDASTASPGWHVDTISITGGGDTVNQPPVITSLTSDATDTVSETIDEVTITYHLVPGTALGLAVTATDDGGEEALTYTWSAAGPAAVGFVPNGSNSSKLTEAAFEALGDYQINVAVTDAAGLTTQGTLWARVTAVADSLDLTPSNVSLAVGAQQQFSAVLLDQFGAPLATQPTSFTWGATGGGTIDAAGLFSATTAGENFTVFAETTDGAQSGFAQVSVTPLAATITLGNLVQEYDGTSKAVSVTTDPAGLAHEVTYNGAPEVPTEVGTYNVEVVITDPNYQGSANAVLEITATADPYEDWAAENFTEEQRLAGLDAPDADPDGDGLTNQFEFLLGFDPNDVNSNLETIIEPDGEGGMRFIVNRVVSTLVFTVESNTDLMSEWQLVASIVLEGGVETADDQSITLPMNGDRRFYRLRVSLPE